jgi:hypothetical protein
MLCVCGGLFWQFESVYRTRPLIGPGGQPAQQIFVLQIYGRPVLPRGGVAGTWRLPL